MRWTYTGSSRDYGEDEFAKNIAKHIVQAREKKPDGDNRRAGRDYQGRDTRRRSECRRDIRPKQTFQAIRIELNRELEVLKGFTG